jgi:hypothetical protein
MSAKHTEGSYLMQGVQELFRTQGPGHHFFGYYDKSPFDAGGRRILCHTVNFNGRMVEKEDTAGIGFWDIKTGKYHQMAKTCSFNWQQGSMLQWMPPGYSQWIIFNNCIDNDYKAVMVNTATGEQRLQPTTIYSLSANGKYAVTPNHRRHYFCRRGYSYCNIRDPKWDHKIPDGDGIHLVNLEEGTERLILTTRQIMERERLPSMDDGHNYLEHMMFNPSGSRFVFMHRWSIADGGISTRLYTAGVEGEEIHRFPDSLYYGHGYWRNDHEYLIYGRMVSNFSKFRNSRGMMRNLLHPLLKLNRALPRTKTLLKFKGRIDSKGLLLLHDRAQKIQMVEQRLVWEDGHCSVRPGKQNHILIDTYPDAFCRQKLMVYDMGGKRLIELADLYCPKEYHAKGYRCDLHPRWDRTGNRVCVDSLQDGTRQMYVYDVSEALKEID